MLITDAAGDQPILYVNPAFARMTGFAPAEVLGRNCRLLQGPDTDARVVLRLREAIRAGREVRETLLNYRKDGTPFWNELFFAPIRDEGVIVKYVGVQTDISVRRDLEHQLAHVSTHDPVTGLANRRGLHDHLAAVHARQERTGARSTLAVFDLDHFKVVNDRHGLQAGDAALRHVAEAIGRAVREGDFACRLGGDEFAVVLHGCEEALALPIVERVRDDAASRDAQIGGITMSVGVVEFDGASGEAPDQLLARADIALDEAKNAGRDRSVPYRSVSSSSLAWVDRVRRAIDEDRLTLHAQPILRLRDRDISHHELLLRPLEEGRAMPPGPFLGAAERFGVIGTIDAWVVGQASGLVRDGHAVAVNLSGRSLGNAALLEQLQAIATDPAVDPAHLTIEVTETAAVGNLAEAAEFAQELRRLGCGLVLDDFGTGFGAFSYLRHLPVTGLKIDMQFIRVLPSSGIDRRIVAGIVGVAEHLGLSTVAEGVEDPSLVDVLAAMGISCAQGYAIGRPAPLAVLSR